MSTKPLFRNILDKYKPENDPITITLPDGEELKFAPITSTAQRTSMMKRAQQWADDLPKVGSTAAKAHPMAEVLVDDMEERVMAFFLAERSLEPKISQRDALELHQAPELIAYIWSRLEFEDKSMQALLNVRLIEEAKKGSKRTRGTGGDSPNADGASQVDTPTT